MADLGDLGSLIGGTATGGLLGIGGAVAGQVLGYFQAKEAAKSALALATVTNAHALAMAQLGGDRARQESEESFALERLKGDLAGLQASIAEQTAIAAKTDQWVANVLALVRPGLTLLLVVCALVVAFKPSLNPFYQFASMASMAVAWWFGSRDQAKRGP